MNTWVNEKENQIAVESLREDMTVISARLSNIEVLMEDCKVDDWVVFLLDRSAAYMEEGMVEALRSVHRFSENGDDDLAAGRLFRLTVPWALHSQVTRRHLLGITEERKPVLVSMGIGSFQDPFWAFAIPAQTQIKWDIIQQSTGYTVKMAMVEPNDEHRMIEIAPAQSDKGETYYLYINDVLVGQYEGKGDKPMTVYRA